MSDEFVHVVAGFVSAVLSCYACDVHLCALFRTKFVKHLRSNPNNGCFVDMQTNSCVSDAMTFGMHVIA